MKTIDILSLATRMFRTRPARTWLTILGIGVGIGAVVSLMGLGYGLQSVLLERIIFGESLLSLNVSNPSSQAIVLDNESVEEILGMDNVENVSVMASYPSLITFEGLTGSVSLQAANASYFKYAGIPISEGEFFKEGELQEVVLSSAVLKMFGSEPADAIGKIVKFRISIPETGTETSQEIFLEKDYIIKGVVENPSSLYAFMNLVEFSAHYIPSFYERAQIKVSSGEFLDSVEAKIIEKGFVVTAFSKMIEQANKIFQGIQTTLGLFGGIALIVSAIGMFNTMTVTLMERTNEIGIMRTIGASATDIMILFLSESIILGFLGGLVGIGVGVGMGVIINVLINTAATRLGGVAMTLFDFPLPFLSFILTFSAFMGLFTGVFPARQASSLNPLDAIRYK